MGKVVGQERADRESQEEAHKNEVRMVEELINGRQAQYFHLVSLRRGSIRAGSRRYAHCSWATITGLLNPSRKAEQINRSDKHAPKNARRAGEIQSTRAFQYGAISTIFHRRNDRIDWRKVPLFPCILFCSPQKFCVDQKLTIRLVLAGFCVDAY